MASYVLLTFDDDTDARKFVEKVNGIYGAVPDDHKSRRVVGVWRRPTKFCECTSSQSARRHTTPYTRGRKYGWFVHSVCMRPTRAWGIGHSHWWTVLGRNLLPGNNHPVPQGWEVRAHDNAVYNVDKGEAHLSRG